MFAALKAPELLKFLFPAEISKRHPKTKASLAAVVNVRYSAPNKIINYHLRPQRARLPVFFS